MKVIFLDFDGVFNCRQSYDDPAIPWPNVAPWSVAAFQEILDRSGAYVVISSSWGITCLKHLRAHGLRCQVLGETSRLQGDRTRGDEIQAWLDTWSRFNPSHPIESIAIIDDDGDGDWMAPNVDRLIRTDPLAYGLTAAHAPQVLNVLSTPYAPRHMWGPTAFEGLRAIRGAMMRWRYL